MADKGVKTRSKAEIRLGASHRDGRGVLVSRTTSIIYPQPPQIIVTMSSPCISLKCLPVVIIKILLALVVCVRIYLTTYMYNLLLAILLSSYHSRRVEYAESHRFVPDLVEGQYPDEYKIRRAGFVLGTKDTLYPYTIDTYRTKEEALVACDSIAAVVLERYRTGKPAPKNIWQAIHANVKLKCPVCRKYNVDPFLFGGKS